MISRVDSLSFAVWEDGSLKRALSVSPDGIDEDIGSPLQFEESYWAGAHPLLDAEGNKEEYPLPFHPLELADAALVERFGYSLEDDSPLDPDSIPLMRFRRSSRQWWKFW